MNLIPKITLDTNCVINLLDSSVKTPTSVNELTRIIRYSLSGQADIAITTRVEDDFDGDKNESRRTDMVKKLSILPVVGTLGRYGVTKWGDGDVYVGKEVEVLFSELQKILFPGLSKADSHFKNKRNDIDHLIGHLLNKRDLFVTDDKGILNKKEGLRLSPGVIVMSPLECLKYLEEIEESKRGVKLFVEEENKTYSSSLLTGMVIFDYSNNNGSFTIGEGYFLFETKWSKASGSSIHAYSDPKSIDCIALAKGVKEIKDILDVSIFDYSSRCRTVSEGEILIIRNINQVYVFVKVLDIKDDSRSDNKDEVTFEYYIQRSDEVS